MNAKSKEKTTTLVIAHNCVLASAQERLVELAKFDDLDLHLLVPPRNLESHGMIDLEKTNDPGYGIIRGKPLFSMVMGQRYAQFYPFLSALMLRLRPKVIDLHEEPWSLVSFHTVMLRNLLLRDCRVIVETEQNIFKKFPPPFSYFEKFVLANADIMIARNTEAREVVRRKGFKGPVHILPNGLDKKVFRPSESVADRERLGLTNFVVGWIGRIEEEKGLDDLLRGVASSGHVTDLLLVGDGAHKTELQALASSLHFQGNVVWHPPVPQSDLPTLLNCMDALVLPSRTTPTWKEQFGRVLVEAMACGVPVTGSDSGAIPEVIGEAGLVFPEGDVDAIRASLDIIYSQRERRREFVRKGFELVDTCYSWECVAIKLYNLFTKPVESLSLDG